MADTKITALTAAATVTDDDLFVVVDSPSSSPVTKKITALNAKTYFASSVSGGARTVRTPEQDGAVGDGRFINDGACTTTTLTSALEAQFVTGDVGKKVWIANAGVLDVDTNLRAVHEATITARASATSVTISPTVVAAVTNALVLIGTDDTTALQTWLNRAAANIELRTTDKVYAHSAVIELDGTGKTDMLLNLGNATFCSVLQTQSAFRFGKCDGLEINGGTFRMLSTSTRGGGGTEQYKLYFGLISGAGSTTRLKVTGVTVEGSYAAGFFAEWTTNFSFTNCTSKGTRADAFHFTQGCKNGKISDCSAIGMSDDGFAVVSSGFNEAAFDTVCRNVTFHRCNVWYAANHVMTGQPGAGNNSGPWGRGLTLVGADNCGFYDCEVVGSGQAGLMFASETGYNAHLVTNCEAEGIRLINCSRNSIYDHGSLFVFNERATPFRNIRFARIEIVDSGSQPTAFTAVKINNSGGGGITNLTMGTTDGPIRLSGTYYQTGGVDLGGVTPTVQSIEFGPRTGPMLTGTATYNPANVADDAEATSTTVTVTGAVVGDIVMGVSHTAASQLWDFRGTVTSSNTVTVQFVNRSGAPVDLASGTLTVVVLKR